MISPVFVELRAATGQFQLKMAEAEATLHRLSRQGASNFDKLAAAGRGAFLGVSAAGAVVGVASIKMAADFQQATNQLITSAGESRANIDLVRKGLLDLSVESGSSATELAKGMYLIESAGFHGADALKVMRAATQGAKAEGASFETVANAVTSAMNAYKIPTGQAVQVTNALVATVASGKMRMEDLAAAIGGVLPVASTAHISLAEVGGAMATMSAQGTPASVAATYLRQTIGQLENPSKKARNEMKALGISALDVSANLGARGLAGTLDFLTQKIQDRMGPAGVAILGSLRAASGDTGKFEKALNELPPSAQTYVGALATMVGGVKTMQAALQLSGPHLADFRANTAKVAAGARDASKDVRGWDVVQQNFNFKLGVLRAQLGKLAIEIGTKLIPVVEAIVGWMTKHKNIVTVLAGAIASALVVAMTAYIAKLTLAAARTWLLIVRTVTLNARVAVAILRARLFAGAMDVEAASATRLSGALAGVVGALDAVLSVTAAKGLSNIPHDLKGLGLNDKVKNLYGDFYNSASPAQRAVLDAHRGDIMAGLAATQKGSFWDKVTGNVHTEKLEQALKALTDALAHPGVDPRLHTKGFIGPTIAEGLAAAGKTGPFSELERGLVKILSKKPGSPGAFGDVMKDLTRLERQIAAADAAMGKHKKAAKSRVAALLKALRVRLAEEKRLALAAQKAEYEARMKTLRAAVKAAEDAQRRAEIALKLARQGTGDLSIVNGSALNAGYSFAQLAQQRNGTTVNLHLGGAFMDLVQLKAALVEALRVEKRRNINVGLA